MDGTHADCLFRSAPPNMAVPDRLNAALVVLVFSAALALLWLASRTAAWYETLAVGVVYSYLMLTNYALLHEASHGNLQSDLRRNRILGVACGLLFPMPYSMMRVTHQGHHLRNRTDHEMFDLYYPTDSKVRRWVQWYGILGGFFWPWIPIGAVLFAVKPQLLRGSLIKRARSTNYLLGDVRRDAIRSIRVEVALTAAFWVAAWWALDLHWWAVATCYASHSFNWSTRQYVGHAFTKRDVIEGAWNLRTNRLMSLVLLHGEYDLSHHRLPEVPWYYLPRVTPAEDARPSYLRQYWRQWLGPRPAEEAAPESLREMPLSIHDEVRQNS